MKSISLYVDNGSYLNKMHPFTKLLYVLVAIAIPLIGGKLWLFPIVIVCSILLLISGKIVKKALPLLGFSLTLIIVIFLIQGLFNHNNQTLLFSIGSINVYKEGVLYASRISCNILNMLLSFAVFVLTTSVTELVDELEKSGFSPKFGYIVTSVFQILPQMMATKDTILDAQKSRGMETDGKLSVRVKAFFPLISPVVTSSLINTRERAVALEVRGFGRKNKKTFLYDHPMDVLDVITDVVLVCVIVSVIILRVVTMK